VRVKMRDGGGVARVLLAAILPLAGGSAAAADPPAREPEAREAMGVFPIEEESLLVIKDIPGQTIVTSREKAREVRFASRATDRSGSERPLGVWFEGSTVFLAALPGETTPDGILRVEIPESFGLRVEASSGTTTVDGLNGAVEVRARDAEIRCRSIGGTLEIEAERGSVSVNDGSGATIRAKGAVVSVSRPQGPILARVEGGTKLSLIEAQGDVEVEGDDAAIVAQDVTGMARVKARGGTAEFKGLRAGGEFQLAACPLKLLEGKGDITVSSDAPVSFEKMTAALHFDLYGGSLRGSLNQGLVEVRTRNTEIVLEGIDGPLRIQGDGLNVNVSGVSGEIYVEAAVSEVTLAKAGAAVGLKIDGGSVTVRGAVGLLSATVNDGDAHLLDLTGPVALEIDGGNAEVSWTSITGETDTLLQNTSGDVTVYFPGNASCRVEAKSKFGRVESDLPTVRVLEDGTEAQGPVGHGRRPTIKVLAEGNVRLLGGSGAPPPAE